MLWPENSGYMTTIDDLSDDLLLSVLGVLCLEPMVATCCPPRGCSVSQRIWPVVTLARALRFALVCRMWRAVGTAHICQSHAAVDARGCPVRLVDGIRLRTLLIDHVRVPPSSSLTALTLQCGHTVGDAGLASALARLACARLRSVGLGGCTLVGKLTLCELGRGKACRDSLTALDLSGLPARASEHLSVLRGCTQLRRLDLSHLGDAAQAFAQFCTHLESLTALSLDGCLLDEEAAHAFAQLRALTELTLRSTRLCAPVVACLLHALPELRHLDLTDSDMWSSAVESRDALLTAGGRGSLSWLGLSQCVWLEQATLDSLRVELAPCIIEHSLPPPRPPAPASRAEADVDSWEDLDELGLAGHLRLLQLPQLDASIPPAVGAAPVSVSRARGWIDYSRPAHQQQMVRSIYHVSQGAQPLYGDGRAAPRQSMTDSHGLRS